MPFFSWSSLFDLFTHAYFDPAFITAFSSRISQLEVSKILHADRISCFRDRLYQLNWF